MTHAAIQELLATIAEYAFLDRGDGHYCTVASNDAKRHAAGTHYEVHVDTNYQAVACYVRDKNGKVIGECRSYTYGKKHCCGHMQAVNRFYMLKRGRLLDENVNPIVEVIRKTALGKFQRVNVRLLQMSADERRSAYESAFHLSA